MKTISSISKAITLAVLATIGLNACSHANQDDDHGKDTQACKCQIENAYAWVNHMPQPRIENAKTPQKNRILHIKAELVPADAFAALERNNEMTTATNLVLNIVESDTASSNETGAKYSEGMARPPFETVSIHCNGLQIFTIDEITKVH